MSEEEAADCVSNNGGVWCTGVDYTKHGLERGPGCHEKQMQFSSIIDCGWNPLRRRV